MARCPGWSSEKRLFVHRTLCKNTIRQQLQNGSLTGSFVVGDGDANSICLPAKPAYGHNDKNKNDVGEAINGEASIAAAVLLALAGSNGAQAQDYPARTATVIVPFAAGGPADITGRIVADIFSRYLGQKFVVENVVGAGGTTGAIRAARAPADGYTILSGHLGTNALAPAFYPNLAYDPQKDFEPIGLTAEYPELLVVRKGFPGQQPQGIRGLCKSQSGKAQCRTRRPRLGVLYRLSAAAFGDRHQADDDSIHRHRARS